MRHAFDCKAAAFERQAQGSAGEQGAVFVKKVPHHPVAQDPLYARCFKKYPGVGCMLQRATHRAQQSIRVRHMLDHMATHHHVDRHIAARCVVEAAPENQPSVQVAVRPRVTGVEAEPAIPRSRDLHQFAQEMALAAADLHHVGIAHPVHLDHLGHQLVQVGIEIGRVRLGVVIVLAVGQLGRIERPIENKTAVFADQQVQLASTCGQRARMVGHHQVLVYRHPIPVQETHGVGAATDGAYFKRHGIHLAASSLQRTGHAGSFPGPATA